MSASGRRRWLDVSTPVVATTIGTSVCRRTLTCGLTGVTNGSPWLGRLNGVLRLTHGIQRYRSTTPFARVSSQSDPATPDRSVAENGITRVAVAPSGSTPPSGTTTVWSSMAGVTLDPSTVTAPSFSRPRGPRTVLSSRRSMPSPERLVATMVTVPTRVRAATASRTSTK